MMHCLMMKCISSKKITSCCALSDLSAAVKIPLHLYCTSDSTYSSSQSTYITTRYIISFKSTYFSLINWFFNTLPLICSMVTTVTYVTWHYFSGSFLFLMCWLTKVIPPYRYFMAYLFIKSEQNEWMRYANFVLAVVSSLSFGKLNFSWEVARETAPFCDFLSM